MLVITRILFHHDAFANVKPEPFAVESIQTWASSTTYDDIPTGRGKLKSY